MVELGLGNPLLLTKSMRARLLGAVRALVDDPALSGMSYGARLAAVVLVAKASARRGHRTVVQTRELGRWLGQSREQVARTVLPELRQAGGLDDRVVLDDSGNPALDCAIVPLVRAQAAGERRVPLALSRSELAVLLALCEELFAPGWGEQGWGLLAGRCGKGAAMDRLGLLLIVLSTAPSGRLRLCPGTVSGDRGRPAATVARLLGCSADAAARMLGRFERAGLVRVSRGETAARMRGRSRVCVVPVAKARGRRTDPGQPYGAGNAGIRDRADTSHEDLGSAGQGGSLGATGVSELEEAPEAGFPDRADASHLHAVHASVAVEAGDGAGVGGFSGEGRGRSCGRPERAGGREDELPGGAPLRAADGEGGPLRGDKPNRHLAHLPQQNGQHLDVADQAPAERSSEQEHAGVPRTWPGPGRGRGWRGRVPRPRGDIEAVLAPVRILWDRLGTSGARRVVEQAARRELRYAAGVVGPERAVGVLSERLTWRLAAQPGGPEAVTDPVGWLRGRGLPRISPCADARCDEGTLMPTGTACERCAELLASRRQRRARVAGQVRAELPDAGSRTRQQAVEHRLRELVAADLVLAERRRRQASEAAAARAAAAQRARAEAEVAEQARRARPCRQCGAPEAGGLCGVCRDLQAVEGHLREAMLAAAAATADLGDPADVDAVRTQVAAAVREEIRLKSRQARAAGGTDRTVAVLARLTAETAAADYRASALALLARFPEADTEARMAAEATMRARHRYPTREAAKEAAAQAAQHARHAAARALFKTRVQALRNAQPPSGRVPGRQGVPDAYAAGAARVRAARQPSRPATAVDVPVRTRENASTGYQRALAAHTNALSR